MWFRSPKFNGLDSKMNSYIWILTQAQTWQREAAARLYSMPAPTAVVTAKFQGYTAANHCWQSQTLLVDPNWLGAWVFLRRVGQSPRKPRNQPLRLRAWVMTWKLMVPGHCQLKIQKNLIAQTASKNLLTFPIHSGLSVRWREILGAIKMPWNYLKPYLSQALCGFFLSEMSSR